MEATGSMIIDIGGGTTEVAVLSMGGLVKSNSIKVAGDQMDAAIGNYIKETHGLLIGEQSAEYLKRELGCAIPFPTPKEARVKGRDIGSGVPREQTLNSLDIGQALAPCLKKILESIQQTLADTPPELASDILDRGIVLCGGGSQLHGFDKLIQETSGVECALAQDPMQCVVRGAGMALEDALLLNRVALA
jgi:rod shape-determining protein MreB